MNGINYFSCLLNCSNIDNNKINENADSGQYNDQVPLYVEVGC